MEKIKVKLKVPVALFSCVERGNEFKIKGDEVVEVYPTLGVLKLLNEKKIIKVNE